MTDFFKNEHKIVKTVIGVAGPVENNQVSPTNLEGWKINTLTINSILKDHDHIPSSTIINDFEALGYGVLYLLEHGFSQDDFKRVYGRYRLGPTRVGEDTLTRSLVCGPGTGLGIACLVEGLEMNGYPYIFSSEGGHQTFAPETQEQFRLLNNSGTFKEKQSYEESLSHSGLRKVYNNIRKEDYNSEPNYDITTKEILFLASNGKDHAATDAIELFCEILANFCGNSALYFNCDRAIFLWGGVLKELPFDLLKSRFKKYYPNRCKHSDRVAKVPVVLLQNKDIPLLGCAHSSYFEVRSTN